uniref:Putative secreted protein n=1 Tax=Anopheles darlingi TaxID=43151 RepID=A0A2M4DQ73_ANODA
MASFRARRFVALAAIAKIWPSRLKALSLIVDCENRLGKGIRDRYLERFDSTCSRDALCGYNIYPPHSIT